MPLALPLRVSSMATADATNSIYSAGSGAVLLGRSSQQDERGRDGDGPQRGDGDDERPDGVAGGVRVAVEDLKDEHAPEDQRRERNGHAGDFQFHLSGNGDDHGLVMECGTTDGGFVSAWLL